jgi:hypothetical protein
MAKVNSIFDCSGSIGHTTFSRRNGKTVAYMRPDIDRDKWRNNKNAILSHLNAQEFGGAAMAGSAIYKALAFGRSRKACMPYGHNHIARQLRKHTPRTKGFLDHYTFEAAIPALRNLDLSREGSPSKSLTFLNIGPVHCPTHTRIQGIRKAAETIDPTGSRNLEFRVTRKNVRFPEIRYDAKDWKWTRTDPGPEILASTHSTLWIPVDCVPKEGITIPLTKQPQGSNSEPCTLNAELPETVFFIVEWRERKPRQKPRKIKSMAIVRAGAIRTTVEHAQQLAIFERATNKTRKYSPQPRNPKRKPVKKALPAYYLRIAIGAG